MEKVMKWAQEVQALAQSGLTYTQNPFDKERFLELEKIAARMMAEATGADAEEVSSVFEVQSGYATPKVDVRGVVFKNKKIFSFPY